MPTCCPRGGACTSPCPGAPRRALLGIRNISGALISHTHADHVSSLTALIQRGLVNGNSIWMYPGWEQASRGPLARVWATLRTAAYERFGFGPAWRPTALTKSYVAGVTRASLVIDDLTVDVTTSSEALRLYVEALARGETGKQFADAASMLTRLRLRARHSTR